QKLDAVNTVLQENLAGMRVAKAFVRASYEKDRFARTNRDYTQTAIKAQRLVAVNMPVLTLILNVSIIVVLLLGGKDVIDDSFEVGKLVAFINYVTQVLFAISSVAMMFVRIASAKVSADRIVEVMNTESEIRNQETAATSELDEDDDTEVVASRERNVAPAIEFRDVSFSYGNGKRGTESVLQQLNFTVKRGEKVA